MIYLSNEPYPQEISVPRSFGVIVPHRNEYLSTADIAADLTTDSDTKVLAASQGVVLKEMVDAKADASDVYTKQEVDEALAGKQDELVAGDNITIEGNVISATGGGSGDSYTRAETDALLAEKADADDVYTKSEVDTALAGKANASAVYTKSEVDAELADKQDVITDLATIRSGAAAGATAVQPAELSAGLATKQDTLESGVNIKTINNQSLLGSGNIDIQGGGGEPEIFWAEYGVTTLAEIETAYNAGKLVACAYGGTDYILASVVAGSFAYFGSISNQTSRYLLRSTISWTAGIRTLEITSDKVSDIPANRTSTSKYPNTKAVYDALGKYGVISQTQTWTGSASTGYTYTMSNQVWGLIPQANIDLYESAGAVFNETTGYFELNGLTDISYNEMQTIYSQTIGVVPLMQNRGLNLTGTNARTNFPMAATTAYGITLNNLAYSNGLIEVVAFKSDMQINSVLSAPFHSCRKLKKIIGVIILAVASGAHASAFGNCASLESITLKGIKIGVTFPESPRLSLESVVYMVTNAANTTAITITLHATAYARCQADTTEYTYQGNTYTGIIAYANARNITIASA